MGQRSDSGRNASLDEKKSRMAGRRGRTGQSAPGRDRVKDAVDELPMKGRTGGASGRDEMANRQGGVGTRGGGGGGGESSPAAASRITTAASKRPARKRGA